MLWKYKAQNTLPVTFYNLLDYHNALRFDVEKKGGKYLNSEWQYIPSDKRTVKFFHGCKDVQSLEKTLYFLKNQRDKKGTFRYTSGGAKIAILTSFDEKASEFAGISILNKQKYCSKHGYDLIVSGENYFGDIPQWNKIFLILTYLQEYNYICWVDLDTIICNSDITIESLKDNDHDLFYSKDPLYTFNGGVFIAKNSDFTFDFFSKVLESVNNHKEFPFDQTPIIDLYTNNKDIQKRIKIYDQRKLNAFWYISEPDMLAVFPNWNKDFCIYQNGDFLVHVTGRSYGERLKLMKMFYNLAK
jgi:hypothetical protein